MIKEYGVKDVLLRIGFSIIITTLICVGGYLLFE
jgi:hypothetical protein